MYVWVDCGVIFSWRSDGKTNKKSQTKRNGVRHKAESQERSHLTLKKETELLLLTSK